MALILKTIFTRAQRTRKSDNTGREYLRHVLAAPEQVIAAERPDILIREIDAARRGGNMTFHTQDEYFKFPESKTVLKGFENSWRAMDVLHRAGQPVPELTTLGEYHIFYGMKALAGSVLKESALDDTAAYAVGRGVGDFMIGMARIFSGREEEFATTRSPELGLTSYMLDRVSSHVDTLAPPQEREACHAALRAYGATRDAPSLHLAHIDLHDGNIIVRGGRLSGIVDFEDLACVRLEKQVEVAALQYNDPFYRKGLMDAFMQSADPFVTPAMKRDLCAYAFCAVVDDIREEGLDTPAGKALYPEAARRAGELAKAHRALVP